MQNKNNDKQLEFFHEYLDKDEQLQLNEKAVKASAPKLITEDTNGTFD